MKTKPKKKHKKGFWYYVSVESPLDERQESALKSIQVETLGAMLILTFLNAWVMDYYKWCETNTAAMMLILAPCLIYFTVKRGVKGCLFGTKGARFELLSMAFWVIFFVFNLCQDIKWAIRGMPLEITHDGMLTLDFCDRIFYLSFFIIAVIMAIFLKREKKAKKRDNDNSEKE